MTFSYTHHMKIPMFSMSVLQRLLHNQLFVIAEKCKFHTTTISFLRFIIAPGQIQMDSVKVSTVTDWPTSTNRKKGPAVFGVCEFLQMFLRNFSSIAVPLHALTSPSVQFVWSPQAEEAFQHLKKISDRPPYSLFQIHCGSSLSRWMPPMMG